MALPPSLPARLYLLAYDPRRQRPVTAYRIQYSLRAAALTDLWLTGHLSDAHGRPALTRGTGTGQVTDPVLAGMLRQIEAGKPRLWEHWIRRPDRTIRAETRDQLVAGGWIRVGSHRRLGLFPTERVAIRDPLLRRRLAAVVSEALRPGRSVANLDPRDAALVALAAAGEARAALPRSAVRQHKDRIDQLTEAAGPAAPALRKAIKHARQSTSA
ncbi:MAG: hypothetical protein V7637_516 [Mycobacteriales bacterium]